MAAKDQELLKKKAASAPKPGVTAKTGSPVPEQGVKLQQGATTDMQENVGNSGLKDLIEGEKQKPSKDPARMSPDELKAKAKEDAEKLAGHKGKGGADKAPAKKADHALDMKEKAKVEDEAARKKAEAQAEKEKVAAEKATAKKKVKKDEKLAKTDKPDAKAAGPDAKAKKKGAGKKPVAPEADKLHAAKGKEVGVKTVGKGKADKDAPAKEAVKEVAGKKKVAAKEADAEHAKSKADLAKGVAGKAAKDIKTPDAAKARLATTGKHAATKKVEAIDAEKKAKDAVARDKKAPEAAAKAQKPGVKAEGLDTKKATKEKGAKAGPGAEDEKKTGAGKDPKDEQARGKRAAAEKKSETKEVEAAATQKLAAEVKTKKAEAEVKADVEADPHKARGAGKEAESRATEEKALEQRVEKKVDEAEAVEEESKKDASVKEVAHASDLDQFDGEEVTVVGVYVPRPAEAGGPQLGHVSIMVGNLEVRLGKDIRNMAEIVRLSGEKVAVTGKIDLRKAAGGNALDPSRKEKPLLTDFRAPHRR